MDYFGREKLKELLELPSGTAVSIYLPTSSASSEAEGDRLRFRAALDRAREMLGDEEGDDDDRHSGDPVRSSRYFPTATTPTKLRRA